MASFGNLGRCVRCCVCLLVLSVVISGCGSDAAVVSEEVGSMPNAGVLHASYVLPSPETDGGISVERALAERRSRRSFSDEALSAEQLSQILWAAYGVSEQASDGSSSGGRLRTAPSAGALYPLEVYVAVGNVTDIEAGVYKYVSQEHALVRVIDGDIRQELSSAALGQAMIVDAPATLIYCGVFDRISDRYGQRGRDRYVFMEIGHSAQNVYLQAEAMGLGACAVGAFTDADVSELLELPAGEDPFYLMPVGHYS